MSYPPPPPENPGPPSQPPSGYSPEGYGSYGPGSPAYGPGGVRMRPYASWLSRAGAYILDWAITSLISFVPMVIGITMVFNQSEVGEYDNIETFNPAGFGIMGIGCLLTLAFTAWNRGIRTGKTGQSIGCKVLNIEVVSVNDARYIGAGSGVLRWILGAILGGVCFINYLWPLWDEQKRTWHDMIMSTVVVQK